jgi:hypothetical protein
VGIVLNKHAATARAATVRLVTALAEIARTEIVPRVTDHPIRGESVLSTHEVIAPPNRAATAPKATDHRVTGHSSHVEFVLNKQEATARSSPAVTVLKATVHALTDLMGTGHAVTVPIPSLAPAVVEANSHVARRLKFPN